MKADLEKQMKAGSFKLNIKRNDKGKVNIVTHDYTKIKTFFNTRIIMDSQSFRKGTR